MTAFARPDVLLSLRLSRQALKLVRERETLHVELDKGAKDGHEIVFFEQARLLLGCPLSPR